MVIYLHWVAVPLVMVLLSALLVWGMRKDPRSRQQAMAREIHSDDPPMEPPHEDRGQNGPTSATAMEQRRLLAEFWGNDCPDMVLTYWAHSDSSAANLSACQQLFLSFHGGMHETLASLENHFFEGAAEQGVPERSRFLVGCTFVRLPHRGQDLVIRSSFQESRFAHEFFLADCDGKMAPLAMDVETSTELVFQTDWLEFRRAVGALVNPEFEGHREEARTHFLSRVAEDPSDAQAHGWLARCERTSADASPRDAARHLAMALEFQPENRLARLESARAGNPRLMRQWLRDALLFIDSRTDFDVQGSYLFAQSLLALDQKAAARMLCEQMLLEFPRHPGAPRLLRQIDQKERGAQT